ncbi:MFS transporter [Streptomyces sp. NBC_00009]|uniref:MFS transporter n=1 Tax=Streptomyces sp. NBC_00009 TaxID=2975620 RepID=UPI00324738A9
MKTHHESGPPPLVSGPDQLPGRAQRKLLAAGLLGSSIEWYDFFLYGTAAALVFPHVFFPHSSALTGTLLSFSTFWAGFLARPIGGAIAGHLGDRHGRKPVVVVALLGMGLATFLIGCLPGAGTIGVAAPLLLVVLRFAQGLACGGQWGGIVLLLTESASPKRRGFAGTFGQMGVPLGIILGNSAFLLTTKLTSDDTFLSWGWRVPFFSSVLLFPVVLFIQTKVEDTPEFEQLRRSAERGARPQVAQAPLKEAKLLVARSHAVRLSSRFDEAIDLARRAAQLIGPEAGPEIGPEAGEDLGEALRAELAVHLDTVHPARAEQVLERLTAVGPHEHDLLAPRIENEINRGRLAHAARLLDRADDAHTAALRPRLLVRQGRLLEARSLLERFTDDHSRIPMAHRESSALLAWMHALLGHADRAAEHARVGIGLGRDLRSPLLTCVSTGRLGLALITGSGPTDVRQAHQHLLESLELAERLGVDRFRAEPLMGLTVLADRMGRPEDTLRFGIDAVEILAAAGDRYLEAMARLAIGAALASRHDPTARTWLKEARELAHECGDALVPLLCDQWLASLDLAEGDRAAFAARAQDVLTRTVDLNLTDIWLTPGWLGITDEAVRRAWLDAARAERCAAAHAAYLQDRISPPTGGTITHPSPPAQSVLRITTLGGFAVDRGGVTLTAESFGRRKAIEILLLLCASERHSQSRAELHDKLWPELSREKASVRFWVALHALHHVLEPERAPREPTRFVRTSADRIWLDPHSVTVDADEFRAHADQLLASAECDPAEGQKVLGAYQQPFLHDYPAFEWAIPVRDELAVRFTELTLATAESLLEAGDHTAAIAACRRLLAHDPFVEPAYEVVAAARLAAGDSAGAHRAFRECERLFEEELDIRPTWTLDSSGVHSVRHVR